MVLGAAKLLPWQTLHAHKHTYMVAKGMSTLSN